jgi:hypothetical protein
LKSYISAANYGLCLIEGNYLSYEYSLANKFLEYVASGIPIISSNFNEMEHLTKKYNLGVSITPNEKELLKLLSEDSLSKNVYYNEIPIELSWSYQKATFLNIIKLVSSN